MDLSILIALSLGLANALHCFGMCGGIVGALSLGLPATVRADRGRLTAYMLAYNLGRLASYSVAGAIFASAGHSLFHTLSPLYGHRIRGVLALSISVAVGLYVAGWLSQLTRLETLGARLWRWLQPLGRRFLPPTSPWQALGLGAISGWLPCGLVYSALLWAATQGNTLKGALYMLFFGLGTLPAVMTAGIFAGSSSRWLRQTRVRLSLGFALIAMSVGGFFLSGGHAIH